MKPSLFPRDSKTNFRSISRWFEGTAEYFLIMGCIVVILVLFSLIGFYVNVLAR